MLTWLVLKVLAGFILFVLREIDEFEIAEIFRIAPGKIINIVSRPRRGFY